MVTLEGLAVGLQERCFLLDSIAAMAVLLFGCRAEHSDCYIFKCDDDSFDLLAHSPYFVTIRISDDCTPERIDYWKQYISFVWGADGEVDCCTVVRWIRFDTSEMIFFHFFFIPTFRTNAMTREGARILI